MACSINDIVGTAKRLIEASRSGGLEGVPFDRIALDAETNPRFSLRVNFWLRGVNIAGFMLVEQQNCCGILLSTQSSVDERHRGKGIGTKLQELKLALAKEFGYSLLMCTVVANNEAECRLLAKTGWTSAWIFTNGRTNNQVRVHFRPVN